MEVSVTRLRAGPHESARPRAQIILRHHVRGRAELFRQLNGVAAADLQTTALVQPAAERKHMRETCTGSHSGDYRLPAQDAVGRVENPSINSELQPPSGLIADPRRTSSRQRDFRALNPLLRQSTSMASRRSSFGKDTGLQARMLLTMFLLVLVYVILIGALIAAGASEVLIVVIAVVLFGFQMFASDKIALASLGAKEVSPADQPELHGIVERLCVQADLPKPRVCVMNTSMPNAFAMGRTQKSATVCATSGILQLLEPAELEGVIAHELTHVINRDVMVMTAAGFFAMIAAFIVQFGFFFGGMGGGGRGRGGRGGNEEGDIMMVILVAMVVYALSFLLLRALSRYREFAADRGSAVLTGRPSALSSALLKISGTMERIPRNDLRNAEGMSAFFIVPAKAKRSMMNIFSDHPPLEKRIAALSRLESQLQGTK